MAADRLASSLFLVSTRHRCSRISLSSGGSVLAIRSGFLMDIIASGHCHSVHLQIKVLVLGRKAGVPYVDDLSFCLF